MRRLLLLSNSTNPEHGFLEHALPHIERFLGSEPRTVAFVPFAAVRVSHDHFTAQVAERLAPIGHTVVSVHAADDPLAVVRQAEAIAVGGGNTFHLLENLYQQGFVDVIRDRVAAGTPYLGWSAGANAACPTIRTTNDMPITQPRTFDALALVPFQINAHYTSARIPGHGGESRDERLAEFVEINTGYTVVGLREGTMLRVEGDVITLLGPHAARIVTRGRNPYDVEPGESLQFLLP